jgi:phage tail-like protein
MPHIVYPPVGFHFKVEIAGFEGENGFQTVDGLGMDITSHDYAEGGENTFTHRFPQQIAYKDLTLKRGIVVNSDFIKWCRDAAELFIFAPRNVTVTLLNEEHQPLAAWHFRNAWPKGWSLTPLDAMSNAVSVESVILAYQYFKRVS